MQQSLKTIFIVLKTHGFALLVLFLGLHFVLFSSIGWDLEYFPGDAGDARFNNYILEHGYRYISGDESTFWNARFMYPEGNVIAYSDNLIGTLPIYSFFRFMSLDRETSFQFWVILIFCLNFFCSYSFLRWLSNNVYAASIGAYIFTFSIAIQSQMAHAQTFPRFLIPLAIWAALLFFKDLNPRYYFYAVMACVGQFYAGIYLGFMLAIPIAILLLLVLIARYEKLLERIRSWRWTVAVIASTVLSVLLMLVLMRPYIELAKGIDNLAYDKISHSIPTLYSYFYGIKGSTWEIFEGLCSEYPEFWNHRIFPGGIAMLSFLVLPLILLIRKLRRLNIDPKVVLLVITGSLTVLFFVRIGEWSLYEALYNLPGFKSMRSLTRIINIELIFFAISTPLVLSMLLSKFNKAPLMIMIILILGLTMYDNKIAPEWTSRTLKSDIQMRHQELKSKMRHIQLGTLVSYEPTKFEVPINFYHIDMMIVSQDLYLKTINAYTARLPKEFIPYGQNPTAENRQHWLASRGISEKVYVVK